MDYAAVADLTERFGEPELLKLSNPGQPQATEIDESRLGAAITRQSRVIDGYVAVRHSLPLPSAPPVLIPICCDLVRHDLDNKREREEIRQRYEDAIKFLEQLAKGEVSLGLAQEPPGVSRIEAWGSTSTFADELNFY